MASGKEKKTPEQESKESAGRQLQSRYKDEYDELVEREKEKREKEKERGKQ